MVNDLQITFGLEDKSFFSWETLLNCLGNAIFPEAGLLILTVELHLLNHLSPFQEYLKNKDQTHFSNGLSTQKTFHL